MYDLKKENEGMRKRERMLGVFELGVFSIEVIVVLVYWFFSIIDIFVLV